MDKKILPIFSIVGTTSVGKSEAVFSLANYVLEQKIADGVIILSADSRQVYQGLEILTGADVPSDFKEINNTLSTKSKVKNNFTSQSVLDQNTEKLPQNYFLKETEFGAVEVHGISIVPPFEEWSVGRFNEYARALIDRAAQQKKLVFVVGGTGLYHEHLFTTDQRLFIPPNLPLREEMQQKTVTELQTQLQVISPQRWKEMNNSDQHNPRRLQRAIEVELVLLLSDSANQTQSTKQVVASNDIKILAKKPELKLHLSNVTTILPKHIYFGLHIPLEELEKRITVRAKARFENGAVEEVKNLLDTAYEKGYPLSHQVESTLGFAEIKQFIMGEISADECQSRWIQADFSYSKRQLTWWKKYGPVQWLEKEDPEWYQKLLLLFESEV